MTPEQTELIVQFKELGYTCRDMALPTPGRFGFFDGGARVVSAPTIDEALEKMQVYMNGGVTV